MTGTCMNVAALHGGVAFNVIPQRARLDWSLRPYPGFDRARFDRAFDPTIAISTTLDHPPFACDALADLVRPFVTRVGAVDFWTEAALFAERGIERVCSYSSSYGEASGSAFGGDCGAAAPT